MREDRFDDGRLTAYLLKDNGNKPSCSGFFRMDERRDTGSREFLRGDPMKTIKALAVSTTATLALALGGCATTGNIPSASAPITQSEAQMGAEAHPQLLQEFGGAMTGPQAQYVEQVGKNIAVQSGLGNARDSFTISMLNSPVNNAFAIPGGYVYTTRQLVALMDNEAELAAVLGHEVGHVAARHSQRRQANAPQLHWSARCSSRFGRWRYRPAAWLAAGVAAADLEFLAQSGNGGRPARHRYLQVRAAIPTPCRPCSPASRPAPPTPVAGLGMRAF